MIATTAHKKGKIGVSERTRVGLLHLYRARMQANFRPYFREFDRHPVTLEKNPASELAYRCSYVWVGEPHPYIGDIQAFFMSVEETLARSEGLSPFLANMTMFQVQERASVLQAFVVHAPVQGIKRPGVFLFSGPYDSGHSVEMAEATIMAEAMCHTWGIGMTRTTTETHDRDLLVHFKEGTQAVNKGFTLSL